jgi:hypothetical protein
MMLIGITLAILALLVIAGCFLVRRWKKQEIEKRRKKAQKAARNTTMSMDELIQAMDVQPKPQSESEKARAAGKAGQVISEEEAEKWAEAMKAGLLDLNEALGKCAQLSNDWGSACYANDSARYNLIPAGGKPELVENMERFSSTVSLYLEQHAQLLETQEALVNFPGAITAPLDKLATGRKAVAKYLKTVARLPEKQLPPNVLTLRIAANLFLTRKENAIANAGKLPSDINGQLSRRKANFYKQTFGSTTPEQDEAERLLLACLEEVFSAGQKLKQAEEAYSALDQTRDRANELIRRLNTNKLETTAEAIDEWLTPLQEAYVEFFTTSEELKFKRLPELESCIKTWKDALNELNVLLVRLGKIKHPTAHFFALREVALSWHGSWSKYQTSFTKPACQMRPNEQSPVVAEQVGAFLEQAKIIASIRAELFTLSEEAEESAQALKDLQSEKSPLPSICDLTERPALKSHMRQTSQKSSNMLLAQAKLELAAEKFRKQVLVFEKEVARLEELLEPLHAHKREHDSELPDAGKPEAFDRLSAQDQARIDACGNLSAKMQEMVKTWRSNAREYQSLPEAVKRPEQASTAVATLVKNIEQKLLEIFKRKAKLDLLLEETRKSWRLVDSARKAFDGLPYLLVEDENGNEIENQSDGGGVLLCLPEKPTDAEVNQYLQSVRQWAFAMRELEQAAGQDRQRMGEELGLLRQDVSDFQSLNLDVLSLERPLHHDDEAILATLGRLAEAHVSTITESYLSEERDWQRRPLPQCSILQVGDDVDGYCAEGETVACFSDSDKVDLITLEALRKSERSLVFALVQSHQAQSKYQAAKNSSPDGANLGINPTFGGVSDEACDFNALIDDMLAYHEKLAAFEQLQIARNQDLKKAVKACDERDVTVVNRENSLAEMLKKLQRARLFGAPQAALDWMDEQVAAQGILKTAVQRRRQRGY